MKFSPELARYVSDLVSASVSYTQIVMKLAIELGYALPIAHRIVEATLAHNGNDGNLFSYPPGTAGLCPDIDTSNRHSVLQLGDSQAMISFEQLAPRVVLIDNFLTDAECGALRCEAEELLSPSLIAADGTEERHERSVRSSRTAKFARDRSVLVRRIEARIETLTGWPTNRGEPLQVQKYEEGEKYDAHYDFFQKESLSYESYIASAGQRVGTLIMYLNQPVSGGSTYFANLGIRIIPRVGSALFFNYLTPDHSSGTLHSGEPVLEGEKWIVTKWFREANWEKESP